MTVYVDDMSVAFTPKHRPGRKYIMCHMIATTDDELHEMAEAIGVNRKWFQGDHYDIAQSKKAEAIKLGAVQITWRQAGAMMFQKRRGLSMSPPETAEKDMMARKHKGQKL